MVNTAFYSEMAGIANDLLEEFNQANVILVPEAKGTGPAYNPGPGVPTKVQHKGATVRGVSQKYIDGKEIIASDLQATLSVAQLTVPEGTAVAVSVRPTVKDTLEINGKSYRIIADKTVPAVGTPVAYIMVIRKF